MNNYLAKFKHKKTSTHTQMSTGWISKYQLTASSSQLSSTHLRSALILNYTITVLYF